MTTRTKKKALRKALKDRSALLCRGRWGLVVSAHTLLFALATYETPLWCCPKVMAVSVQNVIDEARFVYGTACETLVPTVLYR